MEEIRTGEAKGGGETLRKGPGGRRTRAKGSKTERQLERENRLNKSVQQERAKCK